MSGLTPGTLHVIDHVAMLSIEGGDEVIADPERLVLCWNAHDALKEFATYASGLILTVYPHVDPEKLARFNELQDKALNALGRGAS